MENLVRKTSSRDQKLAQAIKKIIEEQNTIVFRIGRKPVRLSKGMSQLLTQIFSMMANGKSVTVVASESEITTQQAAEILSFSRPYVVQLLKDGKIPYRMVGSHRRMLLTDVLAYKRSFEKQRRKSLEALTRQAQALRLGYE